MSDASNGAIDVDGLNAWYDATMKSRSTRKDAFVPGYLRQNRMKPRPGSQAALQQFNDVPLSDVIQGRWYDKLDYQEDMPDPIIRNYGNGVRRNKSGQELDAHCNTPLMSKVMQGVGWNEEEIRRHRVYKKAANFVTRNREKAATAPKHSPKAVWQRYLSETESKASRSSQRSGISNNSNNSRSSESQQLHLSWKDGKASYGQRAASVPLVVPRAVPYSREHDKMVQRAYASLAKLDGRQQQPRRKADPEGDTSQRAQSAGLEKHKRLREALIVLFEDPSRDQVDWPTFRDVAALFEHDSSADEMSAVFDALCGEDGVITRECFEAVAAEEQQHRDAWQPPKNNIGLLNAVKSYRQAELKRFQPEHVPRPSTATGHVRASGSAKQASAIQKRLATPHTRRPGTAQGSVRGISDSSSGATTSTPPPPRPASAAGVRMSDHGSMFNAPVHRPSSSGQPINLRGATPEFELPGLSRQGQGNWRATTSVGGPRGSRPGTAGSNY